MCETVTRRVIASLHINKRHDILVLKPIRRVAVQGELTSKDNNLSADDINVNSRKFKMNSLRVLGFLTSQVAEHTRKLVRILDALDSATLEFQSVKTPGLNICEVHLVRLKRELGRRGLHCIDRFQHS